MLKTMPKIAGLFRLQVLLLICLMPICSTALNTNDEGGQQGQHHQEQQQCDGLCTACKSLRPTRINKICSLSLLDGCSCPEYALNLTMAVSDADRDRDATSTDDSSTSSAAKTLKTRGRNCPAPVLDVGYCPYGQRTDSAGCPLGICKPAPGCQRDADTDSKSDSNSRPTDPANCRIHCPSGQQTDANGCPLCRCRRCDIGEDFERRCAAACAEAGAVPSNRTMTNSHQEVNGDCPICLCLEATTSSSASVKTSPPLPPQASSLAEPAGLCLLRCPNSCGVYGYIDGESRDERGCVRNCACKCPAAGEQGCPSGEHCLRWETDRFGCQACTNCRRISTSAIDTASEQTNCVTKATLSGNAAGATAQQLALIGRLCPARCPSPTDSYLLQQTTPDGCLTCVCQQQQQVTGDTTAAGDISGRSKAPNNNNNNIGFEANNINNNNNRRFPQLTRQICPLAYAFEQRCGKSCGPYGYETDSVSGCQISCRCNCPRRTCSCFYGSRQDAHGCDTCECITASEYMQFGPF